MRRRDVWIPAIAIDRSAREPLARQIARQIAATIRGGRHSVRLPSTRMLARLLSVSRNTVVAAYEELAADDLIRARPGAGVIARGAMARRPLQIMDFANILRAAQYPSRVANVKDPDGNPLYLSW
jgi:DNA-binding GntR family transcriptional regulator